MEGRVRRETGVCSFLILTACMLPAAAAPAAKQVFFDQAEIRNPGAVRMLVDLGLISGYTDGSFRPAASVTREEIAKVIKPQFPETDEAVIAAIVERYKSQDTWKGDTIFEEESFDLLQNILEESGELKARVPYYDLVTTQFSEEALK